MSTRSTWSRLRMGLVVTALAAGLVASSDGASLAAGPTGSLSGTVTEAGGGPLAGVDVQAFCWQVDGAAAGDLCGATSTAPDGTYTLTVAAGTYKVLFDDWPAHERQYHGGGRDLGDASSLEVRVDGGATTTGIGAALVPLRAVSGSVTSSGSPIGGINVTAFEQSGGSWVAGESTLSGPDGTYSLHVADGTYRIGFSDASGPYRTEFFDESGTVELADDVVVAGGDVVGVDADLGRNQPITGTVTVDGVHMPGVVVTAWQQVPGGPGSAWEAVKWTTSRSEGAYTLYLPDGTYRIAFETWQARYEPEYYLEAPSLETATDVVVAGAEVSGIDGSIVSEQPETGPAISGVVTIAGATGPTDAVDVTAYRQNADTGEWVSVKRIGAFPGTEYALHVPEGSYRVGFSHGANRYVAEFYDDARTIEIAADVVVTSDGAAGIDAELAQNHRISGVVTTDPPEGAPPGPQPPGTTISARRWSVASSAWELVGEAFAGPDGAYELFVPDGTYRVGFRNDFFTEWAPTFYDGAETIEEADDVVVAGADVANVNGHLGSGSAGPADPWPAASTLSAAGQDALAPDVAVGPDGDAVVVWYRWDGRTNRVQASTRPAGKTWSAPVTLSAAGAEVWDPQVAVGPQDRAIAVWRRWNGTTYEVQVSSRSSTKAPWSAPVTVSAAGEETSDPQVSVGPQGRAVVVWTRTTTAGSQVRSAARATNGAWSAPTSLSATSGDAWAPQVATGPDGTAVATWSHSSGAEYRVQASVRSAAGSWSPPTYVSAAGADAWDPQVGVGPRGAASVVWWRSDGSHDRVEAAASTPSGSWSAPVAVSSPGQDAHDPQVSVDPTGAVTAGWTRWDGSVDRVQVASQAPSQPWSTPKSLSRAGQGAAAPQLASGPGGRTTVVWTQSDGGTSWVGATTRRSDGSWPPPTNVSGVGARAGRAQVAAGGDGTVAVAWEWRDGPNDRVQGVALDPVKTRGGAGRAR